MVSVIKFNFIFIGKYLKQIQSQNFCNISEIIDMNDTNVYLKFKPVELN